MDRLAAMETFVRVIEAGSFSGAAQQLRVGQPAVSKTIAQLEDRLGVRLLLRSTHSLTPTEAGRNFYDRAKRSIEEAERAELAARGAAATLSGGLRICAAVTFARLHVMPRLPIFLAEHPALDVDVVLQDGDIDLIEAGIDAALRMSPLRDLALTGRKIGHCQWIICRLGFFLSVRVLSRLFRRLFLERLTAAYQAGRLEFFADQAALAEPAAFQTFLAALRKREWVVYAKRPFGGPDAVLAYLSCYTHRIAIANSRLVVFDGERVTFKWKDYRAEAEARYKLITLDADEFIRRFLIHVLPDGFHRIRHYGLFANANRAGNIA